MSTEFHNIIINDKSTKSKSSWQQSLLEKDIDTLKRGRGVVGFQAPTGSGKSRAVKLLFDKYGIKNPLIIKKGSKNNTTIPKQWKSKEQLNAISISLDSLGTSVGSFKEFVEKLNSYGIDFNEIDCYVFDEAHENYAFLFYGHGCHVRHQGANILSTFTDRYNKSSTQPIYQISDKVPIILLSDTLDSIICEELPMYSGILPIDVVVVKPAISYYEDIPIFEHVEKYDETTHIYNNYKSLNEDKIIIYVDKIEYSEELKQKLIRLGVCKHDIRNYHSKSGLSCNISLYPITIFVDGGASGIDDKHVKIIYSLRSEKSTVDSNLADERVNISYDLRQRIGRIRCRGGKVVLIREDIDRDTYIRSLKESYERSYQSNNIYLFFEKIFQQLGYISVDAIQKQRVPGLLINHLKNGIMEQDYDRYTLIQSFRGYISKNNIFFKKIKDILINSKLDEITFDIAKEFNDHIFELSKIFRDFMKITNSISEEYGYTPEYIRKNHISLVKERVITEEIEDNSELKNILYKGHCEICGEERDISELDLARIKEGKDGGKYLESNTILCTPDIHRSWDMGNYKFFKGKNKIELYVSDKKMEKRSVIILIRKNMDKIDELFKRIDLSYLEYRLSNTLSHE